MAKIKVLIAGVNGQVGSAVKELLSTNEKFEIYGFNHSEFDISSRNSVRNIIYELIPDVIVNAAAMTNVDLCETEQNKAYNINSLGARNLMQAANEINAHLIHLSTDYVFNGEKKSPYTEFDIPNPQSVYATSKLGGDNEILIYDKSTVLRVAWVFGNKKGDFFSWVLDGVKNNTIKSLIGDAVCTPTYSNDIAYVINYVILNIRLVFLQKNIENEKLFKLKILRNI